MKNWTKKTNNGARLLSAPVAPFDNLTKEARIVAIKAAIQEVIDNKLNKQNG